MLLGGVNAQHFFLVGCLALAGVSMFFLLRRIGNPIAISLLGAIAYEFSPIMLSFQVSGEGLLVTAALLPAVLLGAVPGPRRAPGRSHGPRWRDAALVDGARSGALFAVVCYANPQAPAFAFLLLVPAVVVPLLRRTDREVRHALVFSASFGVLFLLAAVPVLQILPGFATLIQSTQSTLNSDLLARLAQNSVSDFVTPYLVVGVFPAIAAVLLLTSYADVRASEWAAAASVLLIVVLSDALRVIGPAVAAAFPLIAMYKDFIKLQLVLAVPLVILSITAVRWALAFGMRWRGLPRYGPVIPIALLLVLPLVFGVPPSPLYVTSSSASVNGLALVSGQLGLPTWARVPLAYTEVLDALRREDPDNLNYRVLWIPIDWRLLQTGRATDMNLLVYRGDGSADSQDAVKRTFNAIVSGKEHQISALLADQGVKYIVLDLTDGQDGNGESWEKGPRTVAAVWNTQALVGNPADYKDVLSKTKGLKIVRDTGNWILYRNLDWRPVLSSYAALLRVAGPALDVSSEPARASGIPLSWKGATGVGWSVTANHGIRVAAAQSQARQGPWSLVQALIPVVGGASYQLAGEMDYVQTVQAEAKIVWRGGSAQNATTLLTTGHDGTGIVSLRQVVEAPSWASSAEIDLMGGWSHGSTGFTEYSNITLMASTSPDLTTLSEHPEQLLSLWHELPDFLIETARQPQFGLLAGVNELSLGKGSESANGHGQVRLLTASDLTSAGAWVVSALPNALGIEKFANSGGGSLLVPAAVLKSAPPGSSVVWLEYKPGAAETTDSLVKSVTVSPGGVRISCETSDCTIANVLLVPALSRSSGFARFAYAYSPLLRTPDGSRSPLQFPGDWASLYSPPPRGYPSALYDRSTVIRGLGIVFGHFIALAGLLVGFLRR
jgi:hypothetical protein